MKTKRFVSTLLALLLICSLPVSAFAVTIDYNQPGERIDVNEGDWLEDNDGTVTTNNGNIHYNSNTVKTNNGHVERNYGTVEENNGTIHFNYKRGEVSSTVEENNGTVKINQGTVKENNGTVEINQGTVETNNTTGTVTNIGNGTVKTNYGTVNKEELDGIGDCVITETWYGVQVDNDGAVTLEQKESGQALDLTQFTKEGYELTGYTQAYGMENGKVTLLPSPITVNETSYTADCPNVLTLIWQAIVNPGSGEIAAAASDGTGSFGPGSVISLGGHKFLLVAVVEDLYCLASVDSFEDEALSDLPALLSSLLTEEQLSHVTGEPELLDEALTARFFAGQGSHIVFPCDSGLIFS